MLPDSANLVAALPPGRCDIAGLSQTVAARVLARVYSRVEDGILVGELLIYGGCAVGAAAEGGDRPGHDGQGRCAYAEFGEEAAAGLAGLGVVLFWWVEFGRHFMLLGVDQ